MNGLSWKTFLQKMAEGLLDLLFPVRCIACGEVSGGKLICEECEPKLSRVPAETCFHCGCGWDRCVCGQKGERVFQSVCAPFYYEDRIAHAIGRFKFQGQRELAEFFAQQMLPILERMFQTELFDWILPVPLSEERKRERGYNQSELLAREISQWTGVPAETGILLKRVDNTPQHDLGTEDRASNVKGVYRIEQPERILGRRILLIDDICTTGATLNECARTLYSGGASLVCCGVVALATLQKKAAE